AGMPLLRDLSFYNNAVTARGIRALAASDALPLLRSLRLDWSALGEEGAAALAGWRTDGLRRLYLSACELGDEGLKALARARHLTHLIELDLEENEIEGEGLADLAASGILATVRELSLGENQIDTDGFANLAKAAMPRLVHLVITQNFLGPGGAAALASAEWLGGLRELN